MVFQCKSINDTQKLAIRLAKILNPGCVVVLIGELGSGKTTFTKGFARGIGVRDHVTSPTFKLVSEYEGRRFNLNHIDAYRMEGARDFLNIGGEEYLTPENSITLIEWGDLLDDLYSDDVIRVIFHRVNNQEFVRKIEILGVKSV